MTQSWLRMFSTMKYHVFVRRLEALSVNASWTKLLELSGRLAGW